VLEKNGHRVMLGCDSAETGLFADVASNPPDVAIFSIGAYDPWIWNHANPEQVWSMFQQTHAHYLLADSLGHVQVVERADGTADAKMIAAAGSEQNRIVLREIGGTWTLPIATVSHERAAASNAR